MNGWYLLTCGLLCTVAILAFLGIVACELEIVRRRLKRAELLAKRSLGRNAPSISPEKE